MRLRTKVATGVVCVALTAFIGIRIFVAHDGDQARFQEFVWTLGKWRLFNSDLRAFVTFEVVAEVERSGALPSASAEIAAAELRVWRESVIVEFRDAQASSIDWTATQGMPGISAADVRELANGGRASVVVAKVEAARDLADVDVALRTEGAVIDGYTIRAAWRTEGRLAGFRWFKHACEEMLEMSPRRRLKWILAMALLLAGPVIIWLQNRRRRSGTA